jgi:hypothetical protein
MAGGLAEGNWMGSGRLSKWDDPAYTPPEPPPNAARILGEALLGAEMKKRANTLVIAFDEPQRNIDITRKILVAMRDSYKPDK